MRLFPAKRGIYCRKTISPAVERLTAKRGGLFMPTEHNKDARGPSGLTESELLAWYESLISAGKTRGIALDETRPMAPGRFFVCDTNG